MAHKKISVLFLLVFILTTGCLGVGTFSLVNQRNHPELDWSVYETENFRIIFSNGLEEIAEEAGLSAERIYRVHKMNLGLFFKKKYSVFISDVDDIANGATVPFGYFFVWVSPSRYQDYFTGNQKWLDKVIAHEMVHALIFEGTQSWVNIFGPFTDVPRTIHEGYAQFFALELWGLMRGERWLENAALHSSWKTLGVYSDDGALMYAKGFSQIRYLYAEQPENARQFGLLFKERDLLGTFMFKQAFQNTFDESYKSFNKRWEKDMERYYAQKSEKLESVFEISRPVFIPDFDVIEDIRLIDGIYYIRGIRKSKEPVPALFSYDPERGKLKILTETSFFGLTDMAEEGYFYGKTIRGRYGSLHSRLFHLSADGKKEKALSSDKRAFDPVKREKVLYYLRNTGEGIELIAMDTESRNRQVLFAPLSGEQLYDLTGTGQSLSAAFYHPGEEHYYLFLYDISSGNVELFPVPDRIFRPVISPDGQYIVYGMDEKERAALFILERKSGVKKALTRQRGFLKPTQWSTEGLLCITVPKRGEMSACIIDPMRETDFSEEIPLPSWMSVSPCYTLDSDFSYFEGGEHIGPYRPLNNLKIITFLPFYMDDDFYPGVMTMISEPMGWHNLQIFVGVDSANDNKVYYDMEYTNKRTLFDINISAWSHGDRIDDYLGLELRQQLSGAKASLTLKADSSNSMYGTHTLEGGGGFRKADVFNGFAYETYTTELPEDYTDHYLYLSYKYNHRKPRRIFPYHETGFHAGGAFSLPLDGGSYSAYLLCDGYWIRRFSPFVVSLHGQLHRQWGNPAPQDLPRIRPENHSMLSSITGFRYDKRASVRGCDQDIPARLIGAASAEIRYNYSLLEGALFCDMAYYQEGRIDEEGTLATGGALLRTEMRMMTIAAGYAVNLEDFETPTFFFEIGMVVPF
jgi:hypothetical protein